MEVSALPPLFYKIFQVSYVGYLKKKKKIFLGMKSFC